MKKIFLIVFIMMSMPSIAQLKIDSSQVRFRCGTRTPAIAATIPKSDKARLSSASGPFCIKIFITIFADNDGSNRAATDADAFRQFVGMVNRFQPHNICFILMGIREMRNSDLNIQDTNSEESELNPFRISNVFNVFIHKQTLSGTQVTGGDSYGIPNTDAYVSLSSGNVAAQTDNSTMAHELGHAFGLYHTFEPHLWDPFHGKESVTRSPFNSCYDCDVDGDLLCDTPADPDQDTTDPLAGSYLGANTNASCIYTGTRRDECNVLYTPATDNVMSYGRQACINTFTPGQGGRMRYFLNTESDFQQVMASESIALPILFSVEFSNGYPSVEARNQVTLGGTGLNYTVNGTAVHIVQSKRIVIKGGVRFSPTTSGKTHVFVNPYCQ
jgi:Metallo-peptidase family M12B Reprolysin-like